MIIPPSTPTMIMTADSVVEAVNYTVRTREGASQLLQANLVKGQTRMKWYVDLRSVAKQYHCGELQPYSRILWLIPLFTNLQQGIMPLVKCHC